MLFSKKEVPTLALVICLVIADLFPNLAEARPARCHKKRLQDHLRQLPPNCSGLYFHCKYDKNYYHPICGDDGITYYNQCFMHHWYCETGKHITKVYETACPPGENLAVLCPHHYNIECRQEPLGMEVCDGAGGVWFNMCKFKEETCGLEGVRAMEADNPECHLNKRNNRSRIIDDDY